MDPPPQKKNLFIFQPLLKIQIAIANSWKVIQHMSNEHFYTVGMRLVTSTISHSSVYLFA